MPTTDELAAEIAALRARVERAEAALAIHALKARYAQLVDERYARGRVASDEIVAARAEAIAALFTEDGVWDGGAQLGIARGRAEIAARMRVPTLVFSWHFFVKPQIDVLSPDRARARWDILSPCTTADGAPSWMVGFEDDEYARVGGEWLHRAMKLTPVFMAPHATGWTRILR
ncbi:MAG: nuclear transport factor 2 family protein [Deltaproteobacteria bacterium]|nr:nuclear transport factor 2 family protein [Deltaproteobacteria bacterium]